jgi:signal transduction histidine kinase
MQRWTQRRLLYPLAIFAIIAPTVVMGLFGAYALRDIELRPAQYRKELQDVQAAVDDALEARLTQLAVAPPLDERDALRAADEVDAYFALPQRSVASRSLVGLRGQLKHSNGLDARDESMPSALADIIAGLDALDPQTAAVRGTYTLPRGSPSRPDDIWVVYFQPATRGYVAWKLIPAEVERVVRVQLDELNRAGLDNDSLSVQLINRSDLAITWQPGQRYENLGFAPVHSGLLPDRFISLQLDTDRQFLKDSALLGTIFIVLAVLCVPIVASATLMAVHMILREASEARKKVDFVSNVTHELKTPLTSIRMFVETLKLGRVKDESQREACLEVIMNETDRLGALIDHVLSFSKVENQVKKYNMEPNNLTQVLRDTVALFRGQMEVVTGEIRLKVLPGLPAEAVFDKDGIREVLLNLLSNAIKYSADEKFVTVSVGVAERDLWFSVQDKGIGIPEEDLERIFEKFYRVDQDLSRNVDGTGLGLAICKEIIQAHRGRIHVQSVLGKGSTFTVVIPYVPSPAMSTRKLRNRRIVADGEVSDDTGVESRPALDPAGRVAGMFVTGLLAASIAGGAVFWPGQDAAVLAQDIDEFDEEGPELERPRPAATLRDRPAEDRQGREWARRNTGPSVRPMIVSDGAMIAHTLAPDGERYYFYRPTDGHTESAPRYRLYAVGPDRPETRVADTGAASDPPLFLEDGRIAYLTRRFDLNEDGVVNELDPATLVVAGRDGSNARNVLTLEAGEVPLRFWQEDRRLLVAVPGSGGVHDVDGWIVSVNPSTGERTRVTRGVDVPFVLQDGRLVVARLQPRQDAGPLPTRGVQPRVERDEDDAPQPPSLLEPLEYHIVEPETGTSELLIRPPEATRLHVRGEGSYFGTQVRATERRRTPQHPAAVQPVWPDSDILIVDDAQHRDIRSPNPRYSYKALAWVEGAGLLVIERGNLGSRLLLMDRSLSTHRIAEFSLFATGFQATPDGRMVTWLEVEDTDENGYLEPWTDHARPYYLRLD